MSSNLRCTIKNHFNQFRDVSLPVPLPKLKENTLTFLFVTLSLALYLALNNFNYHRLFNVCCRELEFFRNIDSLLSVVGLLALKGPISKPIRIISYKLKEWFLIFVNYKIDLQTCINILPIFAKFFYFRSSK